jgi:hypothetical protein
MCSGRISSSRSTCDTYRGIVKRHEHHLIRKLRWTSVCVNKYINCIIILKLIWFFKLLNTSVPDGVQERVLHTKFDIYCFCLNPNFNDPQRIKLKIEQHEPRQKPAVHACAPEGLAVHAPHVTPVVVLLNDTNIITSTELVKCCRNISD